MINTNVSNANANNKYIHVTTKTIVVTWYISHSIFQSQSVVMPDTYDDSEKSATFFLKFQKDHKSPANPINSQSILTSNRGKVSNRPVLKYYTNRYTLFFL